MLPVPRCQSHTTFVKSMVSVEKRLDAFESRPNPELLLPMFEELRRTAEQAFIASASNSRSIELLFEQIEKLRYLVKDVGDQVAEERDGRAAERSAELKAVVDMYREERLSRHEIEVAERRDEADERKSRRALRNKLAVIVVTFICSTIAAYQGGRVSASPQCSHSAVSR